LNIAAEIKVSFLAVQDKHITFNVLCNVYPATEVKNYLTTAIGDSLPEPLKKTDYHYSEFPHGLTFYQDCYIEFRELCIDDFPELFV